MKKRSYQIIIFLLCAAAGVVANTRDFTFREEHAPIKSAFEKLFPCVQCLPWSLSLATPAHIERHQETNEQL